MKPKMKDGEKTNLYLDRPVKELLLSLASRERISASQYTERLILGAAKEVGMVVPNSASPAYPSDVAASAALRQAVKAFAPKPAVAEPSAPVSAPSSAGQKRQVRPPKPQVPAPK